MSATNAASDCIVETLPTAFDFRGKQLAFAYLSRQFDTQGGSTCLWDVNVDAVDDDLNAGSFLTADLSVVLAWDAVTPMDIYPSNKVVFRFKIAGVGRLYWVRVRLGLVGSSERLARDVEAIARFCAARYYDERVNRAINSNSHPETVAALRRRGMDFKKEAMGLLGMENGQAVIAGGSAGGVRSSGRPENPWATRLTGRK